MFRLPDDILFNVFLKLDFKSLCRSSQICKQWNLIAESDIIWRKRISKDFGIQSSKGSKVEYERLHCNVSRLSLITLWQTASVIHTTFSNFGQYFTSSSADGIFKVYDSVVPFHNKFQENMKGKFNWAYPAFAEFNKNDERLLVSGLTCENNGEIIIYEV
ncbi:F-box/WD repeat-containing protein 5-like isoform X2, partial [Leptotrombidium deliense]